jgi:NADPH:quinone reductase-like Zn-dependent oxidoreductase
MVNGELSDTEERDEVSMMKMKALFFDEHGGVEKLQYGDVELPPLRPGWVRLRVLAVALNHLDIWIRKGWPTLQFPHVTGADICGEIVEFGAMDEANDGTLQCGDRVIVYPGIYEGEPDRFALRGEESVSPHYSVIGEKYWGGLAEYVDVPYRNLEIAPAGESDEALAAPNLVVTTVWRMLFRQGGLQKGQTVLVVGAGGGVNSLTLQIASVYGADVLVLAGDEEKAERARDLGACEVILYPQVSDWHRTIKSLTEGEGVDLVVDNVGSSTFPKSLKALKRGGTLVTVGNTSGYTLELDNRLVFAHQLRIVGSTMGSREDWIAGLQYMDENGLSVVLDGIHPLREGARLQERMERGSHFGKIVLSPFL